MAAWICNCMFWYTYLDHIYLIHCSWLKNHFIVYKSCQQFTSSVYISKKLMFYHLLLHMWHCSLYIRQLTTTIILFNNLSLTRTSSFWYNLLRLPSYMFSKYGLLWDVDPPNTSLLSAYLILLKSKWLRQSEKLRSIFRVCYQRSMFTFPCFPNKDFVETALSRGPRIFSGVPKSLEKVLEYYFFLLFC